LASSPTPETHVRVACALAGATLSADTKRIPKPAHKTPRIAALFHIGDLPVVVSRREYGSPRWASVVAKEKLLETVSGEEAVRWQPSNPYMLLHRSV
jgi:hypothetical protein